MRTGASLTYPKVRVQILQPTHAIDGHLRPEKLEQVHVKRDLKREKSWLAWDLNP